MCLMNKQNLFDGCEKKTKNVKKTKKKIQSSHDAMKQQTFFVLSCYLCFYGQGDRGLCCTCLSKNVDHLNLTRSHSQRA